MSSSLSISDRCHDYILSSPAQSEFSGACVRFLYACSLWPLLQAPRVLYRLRLTILNRRHRCRCPVLCTDFQPSLCWYPRCGRFVFGTGALLRVCLLRARASNRPCIDERRFLRHGGIWLHSPRILSAQTVAARIYGSMILPTSAVKAA